MAPLTSVERNIARHKPDRRTSNLRGSLLQRTVNEERDPPRKTRVGSGTRQTAWTLKENQKPMEGEDLGTSRQREAEVWSHKRSKASRS